MGHSSENQEKENRRTSRLKETQPAWATVRPMVGKEQLICDLVAMKFTQSADHGESQLRLRRGLESQCGWLGKKELGVRLYLFFFFNL